MPKPVPHNKGDAQKTLNFLKVHEPISDDDAERMMSEVEKGRKRSTPRKIIIG